MPRILLPFGSDTAQPGPRQVWEWSLVLTAMGIRHEVRSGEEGHPFSIWVEEADQDRALEEIRLYEAENSPALEADVSVQARKVGESTYWILLFLAFFYQFVRLDISAFGYDPIPWQELGSVDAWLIQKGEWWRLVTGLTLHADPAHLIGNLIIGGLFVVILSRDLGPGLTWLLVFLTGALGNGVNALVQEPTHVSIGWSTSVFGVVGSLSGLRLLEKKVSGWSRRLLPLPAGLGLLALLGAGGGNTDLGAHLFGFGAGLFLGFGVGFFRLRDRLIGPVWDGSLLISSLILVVCSWLAALLFGTPS